MSTPCLAPPLSVRATCGDNSGAMAEKGRGKQNKPLTLRFMAKQDTRRGKNSAVEYKDKQLETRQVCINSVRG